MPFTFTPTKDLPDVLVVAARAFDDARGSFAETYRRSDFARAGIPDLVQDNHVRSSRGVLRGLHWQVPPAAQGKLVRCLVGEVFDVAVDVRRGSKTFGAWVGERLVPDGRALWVPPGFAHGYVALTEGAEVLYKASAEYSPAHERALRWDDPTVGIRWPMDRPTLAARDATAPLLAGLETGFSAP